MFSSTYFNKQGKAKKEPIQLVEFFENTLNSSSPYVVNELYEAIGTYTFKTEPLFLESKFQQLQTNYKPPILTKVKIQQFKKDLNESNDFKSRKHAEIFVYCCWLRRQYPRLAENSENSEEESLKVDNLNEAVYDYLNDFKLCVMRSNALKEEEEKSVKRIKLTSIL